MTVNELRIGNFIDRNGLMEIIQIQKSGKVKFYDHVNKIETIKSFDIDNFTKPFSLSEEWLLKFGGQKDEYGSIYIQHPTNPNLRFYIVKGFIQETMSFCAPMHNYEHIKYVHLFQNLYFFKTGEELIFK